VGPLEQRAPLYNSVWGYATDNGLGFLEYLQLAEDLDAEPIWVVNAGIAIAEEVPTDTHEAFTSGISPYVQDVLDGIEYATGNTSTRLGALRAQHGRHEPFAPLQYLAIGNEACNYPVSCPDTLNLACMLISPGTEWMVWIVTEMADADMAHGTGSGVPGELRGALQGNQGGVPPHPTHR
jgi:alpha-L-arabinofuranosidase